MTITHWNAALKSLKSSLHEIETLLAWEQLKRSETGPDEPPAFRIGDSIEEDLRNEYLSFLSRTVQLRRLFNNDYLTLSEAERRTIKRQLTEMEQRVYVLNLHQRFLPH